MEKKYQFILRLDKPFDAASYFSNIIPIQGWFLLEEDSEKQPPDIELVLEELSAEKSPLAVGMLSASRVLGLDSRDSSYLQNFKVEQSEQQVGTFDSNLSGAMFRFSADLVLEKVGNQPKLFSLLAVSRNKQKRAISNNLVFSVFPSLDTAKTMGGFITPSVSYVYGDYIHLSAWGLQQGYEVESAEVFANSRSLGMAEIGLGSPAQERSLPDVEGSSSCGISMLIDFSVLKKTGLSEAEIFKTLELSLKITFTSGDTLELSGMGCRLLPPESVKSGVARIEQIATAPDGKTHFSGFYLMPKLQNSSLHLRWSRGAMCLQEPHLSREIRRDISLSYPTIDIGEPSGFNFEVSLGRFPGKLSLEAVGVENIAFDTSGFSAGRSSYPLEPMDKAIQGGLSKLPSTLLKRLDCCKAHQAKVRPKEIDSQRVFFFSHNLSATEGAPKVLLEVVREFRKQNTSSEIILVSPKEGSLREPFEELGVSVKIVPGLDFRHSSELDVQSGRRELLSLIDSFSPSLVYANSIDGFFVIEAGLKNEIPTIWAIHESVLPHSYLMKLDEVFQYSFLRALRECSLALFVSERTRQLFNSFFEGHSSAVIPNSINLDAIDSILDNVAKEDARKALGIAADAVVVSIIGTTTERKGQDVFIREMNTLKNLLPGKKLVFKVVGARQNEFYDSLLRMQKELEMTELEFVQEQPDVSNYFIASDVLVIASREESAPLVSLEAFAFGIPLVSTLAFGLAEQIEPEVNALSFALESEGELASQVSRLVLDLDLGARLTSSARQTLEHKFSRKTQLDSYVKSMQQSIEKH